MNFSMDTYNCRAIFSRYTSKPSHYSSEVAERGLNCTSCARLTNSRELSLSNENQPVLSLLRCQDLLVLHMLIYCTRFQHQSFKC